MGRIPLPARRAWVKLWHRLHIWRLGETRFHHRFLRKYEYGHTLALRKAQKSEENPRCYNRWRWSLWAAYMNLLGNFYARAYDELMLEQVRWKQKQEQDERRKRKGSALLAKLAEELAREKAEEEEAVRLREERHKRIAENPVIYACEVLGLDEGFSRADFKRAYRTAIWNAEDDPDHAHERSMIVYEAADLIRQSKGW